MKERLEAIIKNNRIKLQHLEERISLLNIKYMDLLDENEDDIHLNKLEAEINYLERQQDIIVRTLRDKKRQLRELCV